MVRRSCAGNAMSALVTAMAVGTRSSPLLDPRRPTGTTPVRRDDFTA
ncbi:hypothetical protein [Streptomyces sp. V3I7]|nr:hypothetical protein [Streptomyces sp. V3I7]MDQ0992785.1 hypothetical protein [Streptomyces sp. V3I7]